MVASNQKGMVEAFDITNPHHRLLALQNLLRLCTTVGENLAVLREARETVQQCLDVVAGMEEEGDEDEDT